jgi:glycosyltransferase involved in cell wall biosynthesis
MDNKNTIVKNGKVFWVSWHHNPYNDYLFDELSKIYDLDVFYIKKSLSTHPWSEEPGVKHNAYYLDSLYSIFFALNKSLRKYDIRIIAGWNHPIMISMILILAVTSRKYAIWSDTPALNRNNNWLKKTLRKGWLDFAFKHAKKIMVTGNIGVARFKLLGLKAERILNFPFATNTNYFTPGLDKKATSVALTFISSGRLVNSHKGFDVAINAFALLKKDNPDAGFTYLIAGTGPDEPAIRELILSAGLNDNVKLLGWVQQKDLLSFYLNGDVFLHPSHFDPFPNVVLEAMAVGLPVIGSDAAGSVCDRVVEGISGYIFKDNEVSELKEKLSKMITNVDRLPEMKRASRKTALEWDIRFNINQMKQLVG